MNEPLRRDPGEESVSWADHRKAIASWNAANEQLREENRQLKAANRRLLAAVRGEDKR